MAELEAASAVAGASGSGSSGGGVAGAVGGVIGSIIGAISGNSIAQKQANATVSAANIGANATIQSSKQAADATVQSAKLGADANVESTKISNLGMSDRQQAANLAANQAMDKQFTFTSSQLQNQRDFEQSLINQRNSTFQQAGLPAYLAYMGQNSETLIPHVTQMLGGSREYTSRILGDPTSARFTGDKLQQYYGWGNAIGVVQRYH